MTRKLLLAAVLLVARRLQLVLQHGAVARRPDESHSVVRPHDSLQGGASVLAASTCRGTRRPARCRSAAARPTGAVGDPRNLTYGFDTVAAKKLVRPTVTRRPDSRSGEEVYNTYCAVCHGFTGAGDGPVHEILPLSLLTAQARAYQRRIHLQHAALRPRPHAAVRRQDRPPRRTLGGGGLRAVAAGEGAGDRGAGTTPAAAPAPAKAKGAH